MQLKQRWYRYLAIAFYIFYPLNLVFGLSSAEISTLAIESTKFHTFHQEFLCEGIKLGDLKAVKVAVEKLKAQANKKCPKFNYTAIQLAKHYYDEVQKNKTSIDYKDFYEREQIYKFLDSTKNATSKNLPSTELFDQLFSDKVDPFLTPDKPESLLSKIDHKPTKIEKSLARKPIYLIPISDVDKVEQAKSENDNDQTLLAFEGRPLKEFSDLDRIQGSFPSNGIEFLAVHDLYWTLKGFTKLQEGHIVGLMPFLSKKSIRNLWPAIPSYKRKWEGHNQKVIADLLDTYSADYKAKELLKVIKKSLRRPHLNEVERKILTQAQPTQLGRSKRTFEKISQLMVDQISQGLQGLQSIDTPGEFAINWRLELILNRVLYLINEANHAKLPLAIVGIPSTLDYIHHKLQNLYPFLEIKNFAQEDTLYLSNKDQPPPIEPTITRKETFELNDFEESSRSSSTINSWLPNSDLVKHQDSKTHSSDSNLNYYRSKSERMGIPNLDKTCYASAVIQLLQYSKVKDKLINHPLSVSDPNLNSIKSAVHRHYSSLVTTLERKLSTDISTRMRVFLQSFEKYLYAIKANLDPNAPNGQQSKLIGHQHDAAEFLHFFLDFFQFAQKDNPNRLTLNSNIYTTDKEKLEQEQSEHFSLLPLSLTSKNQHELEKDLVNFFQYEKVDKPVFVESKNKKIEVLKRYTISHLPDSLFIHLKRFDLDSYFVNDLIKLMTPVSIPFSIKIPLDEKNHHYHLKGVVVHQGKKVESGHYVTYSYDYIKKLWTAFDDNTVTEKLTTKQVWVDILQGALIILYERE